MPRAQHLAVDGRSKWIMPSKLNAGNVIADRFEITRSAGSGGMGTVYQARDRSTGKEVALKVLHRMAGNSIEARRFAREGRILEELQHPGIVSYVNSGNLEDGARYLVMEWLEGEDLARRMARGPLSVSEGRKLLQQVASALACAHAAGIVHRDIKPSNLFLCGGQFDRIVLLDFGIAHYADLTTMSALTLTGAIVGTLEYMSPEQAGAASEITPAADIYSLGRVVYQGLAEQPQRAGEHMVAALARILLQQDPPLNQLCPWVPEPLSALIGRMLAKDPTKRPRSGEQLLEQLELITPTTDVDEVAPITAIQSELRGEQSLYSVVLAVPTESLGAAEPIALTAPSQQEAKKALESTLIRHGAHPNWMFDGSLLLTMTPSDSAHDQAAHAARSALLIKTQWRNASLAVATGLGYVANEQVLGEVVDRAAQLLCMRRSAAQESGQIAAMAPGAVWVDTLTASLLERNYILLPVPGGALLTGEMLSSEDARPVMGTLTPCVGRDQDLAILEAIQLHCREDQAAQAVLITAPPGMGKTRLRQEFITRTRRRSRPTSIILCIGEQLSVGAPYSLIGQGLRRLCGIDATMDSSVARERLLTTCKDLLGEEAGVQVARTLGEICQLPFSSDDEREMRSARLDLSTLAQRSLSAFIQFIDGLCRRMPVMLIIDDLHWGDSSSVALLDAALRDLETHPLMVLAFGRPEAKGAFPKVRDWPNVKEIPLSGLSRAASERLIRCVLGTSLSESTIARIATQAAGNALLLEELIRAEKESGSEQVPATVLAILQARMQRLEPLTRSVLGKASVFGRRFWRGGVLALQDSVRPDDVDIELQLLAQAEIIAANKTSHIRGDVEYSFRHPLMSDAAHSLLLDDQKRRYHRLAGLYLEQAGELDPLVIAEHFMASDEPVHAAPHFAGAAAQALSGHDLALARVCAQRGIDCHPQGEVLGSLLGLQAGIHLHSIEFARCAQLAEQALRLLSPDSPRFYPTLYALLVACFMTGSWDALADTAGQFMTIEPRPDSMSTYLETAGIFVSAFSLAGQRLSGRALLARMERQTGSTLEREPLHALWLRHAQHRLSRMLVGEPWAAWRHAEEALAAAERVGNQRWIARMQSEAALAELELGSPQGEARLLAALEKLRELGEPLGYHFTAVKAARWLATREDQGAAAEELASAALQRIQGSGLITGLALWTLSLVQSRRGDAASAEQKARAALQAMSTFWPLRTGVHAQLIRTLLAQSRIDDARLVAEAASAELHSLDGTSIHDLNLRLVVIETAELAGDSAQVTTELRSALSTLRARAERIPDPVWRQSYLENVGENAQLIALGRRLMSGLT